MKSIIAIIALLGSSLASPMAMPLEVIGERDLHHPHSCPSGGTLSPGSGYLSPTLMVPVSAKSPKVRFGSTQVPIITPNDFCTIFNLEIPPTAVGKTCTLEFLFPDHEETSPYFYTGKGHFTFTGYENGSGATLNTTYHEQPNQGPSPPPTVLRPGHRYIIHPGSCAITTGMSGLEVSGMLCSSDTTFAYLQSSQKCPIGFYVTIS
jgi:hypothetical protein